MIKNKINSVFAVLVVFSVMIIPLLNSTQALAVDAFDACNSANTNEDNVICGGKGGKNYEKEKALDEGAKNLINTGLMIVGIASVIVIIVSGVLYIISAGDAGKVKRAKDTLMYAVVGLVISLLAYAIVNFVVANIG